MKLFNAIELNDEQLETMYLDYFNNFIGLKGYANHYGMSYDLAESIIDKGRKVNQSKPCKYTFYIKGDNASYTVSVQPATDYKTAKNLLREAGYTIPDSIITDYKRELI